MDAGVDGLSEFDKASQAAAALHDAARSPRVALVLGSGLGGLADQLEDARGVSYEDIPHFPHSTVEGHVGRLVFGDLEGAPVVAMQGRFHLYEGYTPQQVVLPVRVMRLLGADVLIVTNAAGGLDDAHHAGDLMLITDHIGLPTMAGLNPLRGPNDSRLGERFPSMTSAYDPQLRKLAISAAGEGGVLHTGVYAMVAGPNYESPAELRFLRAVGADAVGMSTVPEVIAARHAGMRVLALSCITNVALSANGSDAPEAAHADVLATAALAAERLTTIVRGVARALAGESSEVRPSRRRRTPRDTGS